MARRGANQLFTDFTRIQPGSCLWMMTVQESITCPVFINSELLPQGDSGTVKEAPAKPWEIAVEHISHVP